jgi:hypothetical protein
MKKIYYNDNCRKTVYTNDNDQIHRENGPAIIVEKSMNNESLTINYTGPTYIERELYYINNRLHREDGPATICYYADITSKTPIITEKRYYVDNRLHREDGPAYTIYNLAGMVTDSRYYLNNEQCLTEEFLIAKLNMILEEKNLTIYHYDSKFGKMFNILDEHGNLFLCNKYENLEAELYELMG